MSYSALFTSGLSLASQPRPEAESSTASKPQTSLVPGIHRSRVRRRRSSLTLATSPISAVKSPLKSANDSLRVALRSPREGSFVGTPQSRAKAMSARNEPPLPAPTSPLPMLPSMPNDIPRNMISIPASSTDGSYSSPTASELYDASRPAWMPPRNPSRKSSGLLPSYYGRGPLSPRSYAANGLDKRIIRGEKDSPVWFEDAEMMKENDTEA